MYSVALEGIVYPPHIHDWYYFISQNLIIALSGNLLGEDDNFVTADRIFQSPRHGSVR